MRWRWLLLGLLIGCDDGASVEPVVPVDAAAVDATPDAAPRDAEPDAIGSDAAMPDAAMPDAAMPDAGRCSAPIEATPTGPLPGAASAARGIDAVEAGAWRTLRDRLIADPDLHWVATYRHETDDFVIAGGPVEARAEVVFRRIDDATSSRFEVVEGALEAIFPSLDADRHDDYAALLAAYAPTGVDRTEMGYAVDDPRTGVLPWGEEAWPLPMQRIAQAFDGPDAPDALAGVWPWAQGGVGTHGGLSLLQSRATFIVSGAGARRGLVVDGAAALVDAAPTALAALGAQTTGGVGPDGTYDDGLYLLRQDGQVQWAALDPDPCVRPEHVVMVLFDGLLATEINYLALDPEPPVLLPAFRALAQEGVVFRHGAVVGFPSLSAPGHMTAGTGLWPGHHGMSGNAFWGRPEQAPLSPFSLLQDPSILGDLDRVWSLYDRFTVPGIETLAQAVHRGIGPEAFAAVVNEVSVEGADWSSVEHLLGAGKASVDSYQTADRLAMLQIRSLMRRAEQPVPTTLQVSFVATDGAGESWGPHSPGLREDVLVEIDRHLGNLRALYAERGVLDRTLFILVSDHGMAMQAPGGVGLSAVVARAGVPTSFVGGGLIYLRTLDVTATRDGAALTVRVLRHDDGAPVEGATVRCEGCAEAEALTDAEGRARLVAEAEAGRLVVEAPRFSPAEQGW